MTYAICIVPVAHVRLIPDHRSEMTSQLLFGESVKVHSLDKDGWMQIEAVHDGYKGYCRANQFFSTSTLIQNKREFTGDWVSAIFLNDQKMMIPFGSNLSILNADLPGSKFTYSGNIYTAGTDAVSAENILNIASMFLNTAYLWGGKSVFGIDCSGFVQSVFKMLDIYLPRDANTQVAEGQPIGFLEETVCGDLAFFDDTDGNIMHVGILINPGQIIHASGNVRVDTIDNEGITNSGTKKRTHRLRIIKRIF